MHYHGKNEDVIVANATNFQIVIDYSVFSKTFIWSLTGIRIMIKNSVRKVNSWKEDFSKMVGKFASNSNIGVKILP